MQLGELIFLIAILLLGAMLVTLAERASYIIKYICTDISIIADVKSQSIVAGVSKLFFTEGHIDDILKTCGPELTLIRWKPMVTNVGDGIILPKKGHHSLSVSQNMLFVL